MIRIIDAPCGAGKTSWAIQEMNRHKDKAYIYCTPFLDEIERIRSECGYQRFREPKPYYGSKIDDFNTLLIDGGCVAVSHVTFLNATPETLERIYEGEYTLILDEALDVVTDFNKIQTVENSPRQTITEHDIAMLKECHVIEIKENYRVEWVGGDYGSDFKFSEVERLAKMGLLFCVRNKLLVTVYPPEMFRLFENVYVLTYLFDGTTLKYYFQLFGLDYELASVYEQGGEYYIGDYSRNADITFRQACRKLITVFDNDRLNGNTRTLSKAWYQKATDSDFKQLKNDLGTYFKRYVKASASNEDIMWTCPSEYERKLRGAGYIKCRNMTSEEKSLPEHRRKEIEKQLACFVPCNAKATNIYRNRWALAYCCNMFLNPMIRGFFTDNNNGRQKHGQEPILPDDNQYALSCLIQWICRSRIRDGQPIIIFIPNKRMRTLLLEWLN